MAILSTKTATELFKNHDLAFAECTIMATMRVHNYEKASLALAPYNTYWHLMSRLVTVDMLTAKRINDTTSIRRRCVDDMVDWIAKEASKLEEGRGLHVARFVFLMTFNYLGRVKKRQWLLLLLHAKRACMTHHHVHMTFSDVCKKAKSRAAPMAILSRIFQESDSMYNVSPQLGVTSFHSWAIHF